MTRTAKEPKETSAQKTAATMRRDLLALGKDGQFFGSEDELIERYGVSRPTLRQAARILEHEQLITVRRGVGGGIFTRLPTSQAVSRVAAVFLQANGTTIRELTEAVQIMSPALARMAASHPNAAGRAALLEWVETDQHKHPSPRSREIVASAVEFGQRLARLADCPPISLFQNVLMELALAETGVNLFATRERIDEVRRYHREVARAIRDGHATKAERLARENAERTLSLLPQAERQMRNGFAAV